MDSHRGWLLLASSYAQSRVTSLTTSHRFVIGLTLRAIALGALSYVIVQLLARTQLYATVTVLVGIVTLIVVSIANAIAQADRSLERFIEALATDQVDTPTRLSGSRLLASLQKSIDSLRAGRIQQQQELEYVRALLDTVAAALMVMQADGRVSLINRAARTLARGATDRINGVAGIGDFAAETILGLPPGGRQVVRFANGQQMYVAAVQFSVPGRPAERLISIQRIAGELDAVEVKAWNDMARVLAHEMMNSLTPIASLSESLEQLLQETSANGRRELSDADAELASALEAIKRRSHGLMDFVERYRSVADLPQPTLQTITLRELLDSIERLMSATFKDKQIDYRSEVSPPELSLRADPGLLEQAMINLLQNAAEAVAGCIQPQVDIACELREGKVVIAIKDNGRGLPKKHGEQVFVPFFTTKRGGSGIGLSIARHVALAHGGLLDVRANTDGGSVFSLIFPAMSELHVIPQTDVDGGNGERRMR